MLTTISAALRLFAPAALAANLASPAIPVLPRAAGPAVSPLAAPVPAATSAAAAAEQLAGEPGHYLLLHGLGVAANTWAPVQALLERTGARAEALDFDNASFHRNVDELAADIVRRDLRGVTLVGHSYGGGLALALGARPELRGRIKAIHAITPYTEHVGLRMNEANWDKVESLWNLNPLHRLAMALPLNPWKFWFRTASAAWRAVGRASVRMTSPIGLAYLQLKLGPKAAAMAAGVPERVGGTIPAEIPVTIILGKRGSTVPDQFAKMFLAMGWNPDEMVHDYARGKPNVRVVELGEGSHLLVFEIPEKLVRTIVGR